jgi:putative peptidoglycan lipid II flippase
MKILEYKKWINFWKKFTSGSTNHQILGAAVTVGIATALVKVAAVFKELVVAWKFGTADALDGFLIALVVPTFIINVAAGSFNAALIPAYIRVREQEGINAAQKLFSGATVWSLGLLAITTILMLLMAPMFLPLMARGFSQEKLDLTYKLLWAITPLVLLDGIIVMWNAVLNAGERFALAALCPVMTPVITIVLLLQFQSWGAFALITGLILGAVLEIIILGVALKRQGISLMPRWYGFDSHMRQIVSQYAPIMAGAFLMCSSNLVDQSMAAMLQPGSVAALNYGNKVIALPLSLSSTALSTAVIPYFSKMAANEDWTGVRSTLKHFLRLILIFAIPLTAIFIVFSEVIVQTLFQRGSFTASDTHLVAQIQAFYALQIPFYIMAIFVVKLIISMQITHFLMWGSALNLIINIVADYIFMHWFGVKGIALSTSCVYLFSFSFLLFFALRHLEKYHPPVIEQQP